MERSVDQRSEAGFKTKHVAYLTKSLRLPASLPAMPSSSSPLELIALAEHSLSIARSLSFSLTPEPLSPYTDGTVLSLSWHAGTARSTCELYRNAIVLITTGGSVLIGGLVFTGLYFAGIYKTYAAILGPVMLSFGLMVLVIGIVLVPITQEMRQNAFKRMCSWYGSQYSV
ncbi:uncharacterized protein LOC108273025 [Ictalurus punctatus]|uniref:Uncharacterized protein LOC108273025 n=1 Tax=Ictalurus punctatus TaxID=7998 RepID=A0A2D0S401_ICTPU|nr:uncharacterized protein LOC108273025 [Ictalurus punctatus]